MGGPQVGLRNGATGSESNQRPPAYKAGALPLSYSSVNWWRLPPLWGGPIPVSTTGEDEFPPIPPMTWRPARDLNPHHTGLEPGIMPLEQRAV